MRKSYIFIIAIAIAAIVASVSCQKHYVSYKSDSTVGNKLITIKGALRLPSGDSSMYEGCEILSIDGASNIEDGSFQVGAYTNDKVQTFIVQDNNEVYLMSREPISNGQQIDLSAQSTAVAMVTMHPLFSPVGKNDYATLRKLIVESPKFQAFYEEVEKSIASKRHLYDESNNGLLIAFSNLMEELCGESENNGSYDGTLDDVSSTGTSSIETRAVYQHSQINPTYIDAQINGRTLSLSTVWMTPSYYGTVSQPNGQIVNKVIPSRADFGIMDLALNRTTRGEPMKYTFTDEGNYKFNFSRVNEDATLDFYKGIAESILSTIGFSLADGDTAIVEAAKYIGNAMIAAGSGVIADGSMSALDWLSIAYDAALTQISATGKLGSYTFSEAFVKFSRIVSSSLGWYNKIKGAANVGLRLAYAFDAPETIDFCLCFYENVVTTCTVASLYKVSGDEQIGYAKQRLLTPITVYVQTLGDDGMYYESSSYHRVKFEVVSGGGQVEFDMVSADNNKQASTYWTLGESGDQKVKATVVDIITEKEISEPVYFTADLNTADITIRLDWSKHSCNTDIDLHVVDPFDEEIYYRHMTSASGGYLDRDDVVGPGPEHVRWSEAPAGTYKIYVHYYPNGAEDRSVTSYKVSVNVCGVDYRPKTGSIAYDQYVPVGQFTIGEESATRSTSVVLNPTDAPVEKPIFPKK